ncbi:uncharacterized protein LOC122260465 [Penaeus japonicus]|uniref:uncharacterized protein LOC122260465 n=1 Tax=Penaeus japonicus TaxID=27405 RepID=UPI001C7131B7|nr:uncharacterized protein LOC122260465 [Penaeus japonicus]
MSHNRNAKMGEMRTACFRRVEQILNAVKIAGAPVTVTRLKKMLTIGKERNCSAVCMMLHFPVYQSSLKTTCNHAYPKRRKTAQTTGSVDYFHPGKKLSCTKSNLPMELLRNVGGNSSLDPLENERGAAAILRTLDGVKQVVRRNAEVVRTFAERLQENFLAGSLLSGADVMHAGSAYEGLSVKPKTDFDVIVVLALQELAGGFEVIRDESMFFMLKTNTGYVNAETLQKRLFRELTECVEKTRVNGATVRCRDGLASLDVEIETASDTISVDLSPQIPVRSWGRCPDLINLSNLPRCLQRYIHVLNRNGSPVMFFSPAVPGRHKNGHLCNVSFSMLEKRFLRENTKIRDMVRLVKATAVCQEWKENYGLKSFHIKRVAVKYSDELEGETLWSGYKLLLRKLLEELTRTDTFDGFFLRDQVIYKKKPEKVDRLMKEIKQVLTWSSGALLTAWEEHAKRA